MGFDHKRVLEPYYCVIMNILRKKKKGRKRRERRNELHELAVVVKD